MAYEDEGDIAKAMGVNPGPSLHINHKQFPDVSKLDVGEEVEWKIKGIVQSVSAYGPTSYSKANANASINIISIDGKNTTVKPTKRKSCELVDYVY